MSGDLTTTPATSSPAQLLTETGTIVTGRERSLRWRSLGGISIVLVPIGLFVILSFATPTFLTASNLTNVLNASTALGLVACAGTVVIIAGGFDISAGAIFSVAAMSGALVSNVSGPVVGIVVGLVVGCLLGAVNGAIVTIGRINPFVASLGTMIAFTGVGTVISGAGTIIITDPSFALFSNTTILGIRLSGWILVLFVVFCSVLLNVTIFGRHVYATGGNAQAARMSGVSVHRTLAISYVISGGAAALAGLLVAGTSLSVTGTGGSNLIWNALAAVMIGSISGGRGSIWRTLVGVVTLALIANGFNLIGIDPSYQQIVSGSIILIAVGVDAWTRKDA